MAKSGDPRSAKSDPAGVASEVIELRRALRGSDLWSALEAAQSSRVMTHEEPDSPAEEEALIALAEALERAIEAWDEEGLQNKAPLLRLLDDGLAALKRQGLSLYWGCVERRLTFSGGRTLPMRVAVIAINRSDAPTQRVAVPLVLDASGAEPRANEADEED